MAALEGHPAPASNALPHHGRADQAGPTANEDAHDLSPLWKPAHPLTRRAIMALR